MCVVVVVTTVPGEVSTELIDCRSRCQRDRSMPVTDCVWVTSPSAVVGRKRASDRSSRSLDEGIGLSDYVAIGVVDG